MTDGFVYEIVVKKELMRTKTMDYSEASNKFFLLKELFPDYEFEIKSMKQ